MPPVFVRVAFLKVPQPLVVLAECAFPFDVLPAVLVLYDFHLDQSTDDSQQSPHQGDSNSRRC